jgi:Cu-processing system ATP-binding protein
VIRFTEATKRFAGRVIVDELTLDIRTGDITALLGPNGSGKTTTLKMAAGLIKPDAGTITIDGEPAWNAHARGRLAYLPQRVSFAEGLTGREVVEFYRRVRGAPPESTDDALRFAALNGASARPVATYSGGMIQRLGLAIVTLPCTEMLLLDEPGAALDPQGLAAFHRVMTDARGARTVLFTSHQIAEVERIADRVLVLVGGALVADLSRAGRQAWRDVHGTAPLDQWYTALVEAAVAGEKGHGAWPAR